MNTAGQNVGDLITRANLVTWLASTEGKSHLEDREMETGGQIRSNLVIIGHNLALSSKNTLHTLLMQYLNL